MTAIEQIRAALERGERLTSLDALRRFGCSRLAAVIHRLIKRDGMQIESHLVEVETSTGSFAHVAEYRMVEAP